MKAFIKCEMCKEEISNEKCIFATYKRVIGGKEHFFCCKDHADLFEQKQRKQD